MNRILILDDRPINRQFLSTLLGYKGFETREASDGQEGLAVARVWRPDLAIVDIVMPGMNGVEFVRQLRADPELCSTPIIFYTASYQETEANRTARELGIEYVLVKPSEAELILATIDKALGTSRQPAAIAADTTAHDDFVRLQSDALKVAALVEFQLEITAQRQPADILRILSRASRNIVASQYGVVTLFDGEKTLGFSSSRGEAADLPNEDRGWPPGCAEYLRELMAANRAIRTTSSADPKTCAIWPMEVRSYLGVPIQTAKQVYGWVNVMNRVGAEEYSLEDERIALTIAAQTALAYENLLLFEKLRTSEERFRSLVENSADGILLLDRDANIIYASPAITRILGYEVGSVAGTNALTLVHPEDRLQIAERLEVIFEGHLEQVIVEARALHHDGSWRYIAAVGRNGLDDPAVRGIILNYRDVTEHRKSREMFDELWKQHFLILNSINEGVLGIDLEDKIIFENPASATTLGWEPKELLGRSAHATYHHDRAGGAPYPRDECPISQTEIDGVSRHKSDELFWRKDGTSFPVEYETAPICDDDDDKVIGVVVTFRDITKQKQMEQQIEQAIRVSSLGSVAASLAHEFNNVLMSIQPFAEILKRKLADDTAAGKPVRRILDAVKRGQRVTQEVLRFTSPAQPRLETLDACAWTQEFSDEARQTLGDRQMTTELESTPLIVSADRAQLFQVMINLVVNARDATQTGASVTIGAMRADKSPFLSQCQHDPERFAALFVRDCGHGIHPDLLDRIFEPLFTTKKSGGTGLGLAVAHQIIQTHGGSILVDSSPPNGTTFYVLLPIQSA